MNEIFQILIIGANAIRILVVYIYTEFRGKGMKRLTRT